MQNQGYRPTSSNGHPARSKWLVPAAGFIVLVAVFVAVFPAVSFLAMTLYTVNTNKAKKCFWIIYISTTFILAA